MFCEIFLFFIFWDVITVSVCVDACVCLCMCVCALIICTNNNNNNMVIYNQTLQKKFNHYAFPTSSTWTSRSRRTSSPTPTRVDRCLARRSRTCHSQPIEFRWCRCREKQTRSRNDDWQTRPEWPRPTTRSSNCTTHSFDCSTIVCPSDRSRVARIGTPRRRRRCVSRGTWRAVSGHDLARTCTFCCTMIASYSCPCKVS